MERVRRLENNLRGIRLSRQEYEQSLIEASVAPAQAETVDLKGYYDGPRKDAWYSSLVKEYEKMKKGVLEETLRSEARGS